MARKTPETQGRSVSILPGVIYLTIFLAFAVLYRFLFPPEGRVLPPFTTKFRLFGGFLLYIQWFPSLVMASIVLLFGFYHGSDTGGKRFETGFIMKMRGPLMYAFLCSALNGVFSLALRPSLETSQGAAVFRTSLYTTSLESVDKYRNAGNALEASYALSICERIWPENRSLASMRDEIDDEVANTRKIIVQEEAPKTKSFGSRSPVSARDALDFARAAFAEGRYFDAHWLGSLAARLARPGGVEIDAGNEIASKSWEAVKSLSPDTDEKEAWERYRLKRQGYEALISGEWIHAYYVFKEYRTLAPGDPDGEAFFERAKEGLEEAGFFVTDMREGGAVLIRNAVFSLPREAAGRLVLRFDTLSLYEDYAWVHGVEAMAFDAAANPRFRVTAPYGRLTPYKMENEGERVIMLMRALDREDETVRWEPEWTFYTENRPGAEELIQLPLDISFADFSMSAVSERDGGSFYLGELFTAPARLGPYGAVSEVFRAEIVREISEPLGFLAIAVFTLVIGWQYRPKKRSSWLLLLMPAALPLIFNIVIDALRDMSSSVSVFLAFSLPLPLSIAASAGLCVFLFTVAMFTLAAQRG